MKFKYAQWVLFLIVAIGTVVALIGFDLRGQQGIMTLVAGLSASLFVFCFVPYGRKYYLSELMIIMFAFSVVMTFYANTLQIKNSVSTIWEGVLIWSYVIVALTAPFVTYGILEGRRPIHERISTLEAEERKPKLVIKTPEERMRSARISMVINVALLIIFIVPYYYFSGRILPWVMLILPLNIHNAWNEFKLARQDADTIRQDTNRKAELIDDSSIASNQAED